MMSRPLVFLGVFLLVASQAAEDIDFLDEVIERALDNLKLYESGVDNGQPIFNSHGVALDVGMLNNVTFPLMSENLRISIAGCHKIMTTSGRNKYPVVLSKMMQSPLMQPKEDSSINRMDKFLPQKSKWWNFLGKSEATKRQELNDWFLELITDQSFLNATRLNAESCISMAKTALLIFDKIRHSCGDVDEGMKQRDLINLSVLQYPQSNAGNFILHRVHVFGWVDCKSSNGGITGEYIKREFSSRYAIISKLSETSRGKALKYIDGVFSEIYPKPDPVTERPTTSDSAGSGTTPRPNLLLTSTTAAITTAASVTKTPDNDDDDDDDDDDIC